MKKATFIFQGDLPSFLPLQHRTGIYIARFQGRQSVKHLIESAGIPHTEVIRVKVNQKPVSMNYIVEDSDSIEVTPINETGDLDSIQEANALDSVLASSNRFILDNHLGRLAGYLRLLGFDCLYDHRLEDTALAELACQEHRILLTRDRRLLMRKIITSGYCVRSLIPEEQVVEVLKRFRLTNRIQPFRRCLRCNALLEPIGKDVILERLQPLTRQYFNDFHHCINCDQIYWKGSHYEKMLQFIHRIEQNSGA